MGFLLPNTRASITIITATITMHRTGIHILLDDLDDFVLVFAFKIPPTFIIIIRSFFYDEIQYFYLIKHRFYFYLWTLVIISSVVLLIFSILHNSVGCKRKRSPHSHAETSLKEEIYENYLCTRAPAPPMSASTSFLDAMVVSPGVVIAKAP